MRPANIETASLIGVKLVRASSSLGNFAVELGDGRGISIEAILEDEAPKVRLSIVSAAETASPSAANCFTPPGPILWYLATLGVEV